MLGFISCILLLFYLGVPWELGVYFLGLYFFLFCFWRLAVWLKDK